MKKSVYRKGLVLGIILLFLGVSLAPGITATVDFSDFSTPNITENKELNNDLVEITVEVGNSEYKVMLTPDPVIELNNLIESTKTRLNAATSVEETAQIFDDTVLSLFDLGVLPEGLSIEEAKGIVNGKEQDSNIVKTFKRWYTRNLGNLDDDENFMCLIAGHTNNTFFWPLLPSIMVLFGINPFNIPLFILIPICFILVPIWLLNPFPFGNTIILGKVGGNQYFKYPIPANGWIHTIGLNGIKNWSGSFFGSIRQSYPPFDVYNLEGVLGFTGIRIGFLFTHFYIGSALWVKID